MTVSSMVLVGLFSSAHAGSGPWTLSPGDLDLYVGSESRRTTTLVNGAGTSADLTGGGVSTIGAVGVVSMGIVSRVEGSLMVPAYRSRSLDSSDEDCDNIGLQACKTSEGVGTISMRLKGLLLDELYGPPLSVAVSGELRMGDLTAPTRARLTALGEGTTDLGAFLSAGRSGGLGSEGLWSAFGEFGYRYRFPNAYRDGDPLPGSEWLGGVEALFGPSQTWIIGPAVYGLVRPQGFDLEQVDFTDSERFVGLSATNVQAGGKLILRSSSQWSVSLSGLRTVYARNSFGDELIISAGIATWRPASGEGG